MKKSNKKYLTYVFLLVAISIAITVLLLPKGKINEFSNFKIGLLAPKKVVSPFDFEILRSEEELKEVRAKVRSIVLPVFVYSDTLNLSLYRNYSKFYKSFDDLRDMRIKLDILQVKQNFYNIKKDSLMKKDSTSYLFNKLALDSILVTHKTEA